MNRGAQINEETIVPGGEKPAGPRIEDHDSEKVGFPTSGFATAAVTAGKGLENMDFRDKREAL
jgi:hypothetical protein